MRGKHTSQTEHEFFFFFEGLCQFILVEKQLILSNQKHRKQLDLLLRKIS